MTEQEAGLEAIVSPSIHVAIGSGEDAVAHELAWADIAFNPETGVADNIATISDKNLLSRLEDHLSEIVPGARPGFLTGRLIQRVENGNILVGAPNEYGYVLGN